MSAKWRALQHRHRFTYSALIFPPHFTDALNQTPSDTDSSFSSHFCTELKELVSLNSIYAQVNHAKNVASAFESLLKNGDEGSVSVAARFYLEILFLENSLQLHRTLVSVLAKVKNFKSVIRNCFQKLCEDYSGVNGKGKRFCVSRVALSMMSSPKLGYLLEIVEECVIMVVLDIVVGLEGVVSETNICSRPSPIVMEQCQEALSCMYYLLQRFPTKFGDLNSQLSSLVFEDSHILQMLVTTIFSILKSTAFSRDCFVAAGVSFCAALQACLGPQELGLFIMEGVFYHKVVGLSSKFDDLISRVPYKGNLHLEIKELSALSRLCLIRGILTAVPRTVLNTRFVVSKDTLNGFNAHADRGSLVQTILYDGILPKLCNYCENPTDGHFNFHALTVVQICLQQIKTLIQTSPSDITEDYDMISEDMGTRILRIIWNNLEDPLSQTVKQVHLIFDLFLDIQSALFWGESSERIKFFLLKIATDLLNMGSRCKGRYVPLASLTKRLGAKSLLDICPDLLFQTTQAYIDDDVCCAATTFLKCFLECLRDEWWSTDGIEGGYIKYRSQCLPPFLYGLASGFSKLRSNLNTYALPALLNVDVDSIFPMLAFISVGQGEEETKMLYPELNCADATLKVEQQVAVLLSLLKVSRMLALIEGDIDWCSDSSSTLEVIGTKIPILDCHAFVCIKGIKVKVLVRWLVLALTHVDDSLRIDAAETLLLSPKTSSLPSSLELTLMKETVPLNMRCCSTAFQMKWTSLFRKFFSRVQTALERQIKLGIWHPHASIGENDVSLCKGTDRAEHLYHVMKWLSCFLFSSCYPSAPYERKLMAMELMLIMINVWSIVPPSHGNCDPDNSQISLYPYSKGFTLPDSTLLMVGSIVDSWDRLRERAFRILLQFPSPLPGISSPDMVREAIVWAKKLVCSPRVRECDAGALTLRLLFRKYVLNLGWTVQTSCNVVSVQQKAETINGDYQNCSSHSPAIEYIKSLIDWLSAIVEEADKDLPGACRKSFVHGVLLTFRYTFEELDWNSDMVVCSISEMKHALEKLLDLVMRITSLALWVVSADAWYLPEDMDDMVDEDAFSMEDPIEDASVPGPDNEKNNSKLVQDMRSSEQIVMVGCWLAMKEVSLLLGTIIRKIPLPTSDMPKFGDALSNTSDVILDLQQLEAIGNHFLEVLLKMKHNGAIDKTRAGFAALCNRLLCSNDPRLCKLTESWMEQLMQRTVAKGQTVDDLLRRSAGIPAAFTAFFLSEPEGTPKKLLPRALRWLIGVASQSFIDQTESNLSDNIYNDEFSKKCNQASVSTLSNQRDENERISKMRDEGVIPTVHAFNVLRAAFNDTNLAVDTSGFSADALIVSIRSFSSTYWEVRNSACLAYTALVRRMLGFFNVQKRESARRALTGLEFFHRYPSLHTFLYNELKVATDLLGHGSSEHLHSNLADVVHPSLCPMLILLSRLKPSTITSETGDAFDPFLFLPFIKRCSSQSNLRVRVLASRALTGLVSNEKLPNVLLNIALELPSRDSYLSLNFDTSNSVYITNGAQCASFNSMHGVLLLLNSLVDGNCRNLADIYRKDQILVELIQVLMRCSWTGRPWLCPCPILNGCFLKVLDNMLGIARTCPKSKSIVAIWNLIWELTWECIEVQASCGPSYYDPTVAELRRQAAYSYFNCFFQTSKDSDGEEFQVPWGFCLPTSGCSELSEVEIDFLRFQERLVLCMSHESYEVRLATFKWLLQFLKATESGEENCNESNNVISLIRWTKSNLQEMLMKLLTLETNHRCRYYILRLIFTWNLLQFQKVNKQEPAETIYIGVMNSDLVLQFWDKLVSLYKLTRHAKSRETVIRCMGICVKRMADLLLTSFFPDMEKRKNDKFSPSDQSERLLSCLYDCISYYSKLIEQHSESSEPLNMRKATAESMVASNLLEQAEAVGSSVFNVPIASENPCSSHIKREDAVNMYAHKILDMWFICIKLLEDEDVGLRRKLAMDIQKCFHSQRSGRNFQIGANSIQVEKVIELSFEHLSSIFGHWIYYFDCLCHWVSSAANSVTSRGDLVRRVFDKEIDNHHEEKLLISQICCYQLEKLPISTSWAMGFPEEHGVRTSLDNWRKKFFQQLISFANDHIDKQGVNWIGGVGNHKDAFLPLYAGLLGFFTLSKCIFNGDPPSGRSLVSELNELGKTINPFLRNPLIYNLYLLVVKFYEKMIGAPVDGSIYKTPGEDCLWENFDAYFLLR